MRDEFNKQLEELHELLLEMGALCEEVIEGTCTALIHRDKKMAAGIIARDRDIDRKERDIESKCLKLFLEQQPVAGDLRKISAALKMITDLERIGDQAADIAEIVKTTDLEVTVKATHIGEMAKAAVKMVRESMEAFVNGDLELARKVISYDDVVDGLFVDIRNELAGGIAGGQASQEQILDLLMVAKYYERIGDHATNIAEWVEYSITGIHRNSEMGAEE